MMLTVFERIPEIFIELYDQQFKLWAQEFRTRGPKCAIVFNPAPGSAPVFDGDGRLVAVGCWLRAEVDRSLPQTPRVVIRPASEHDEEMIARHSREMARHVLQ